MKLLSIQEIQADLDEEFIPLEPILSGYRIIRRTLPENYLVEAETTLGIKFPDVFRKTISAFDFGMLSIGPIFFAQKVIMLKN